MGLKVQKAPVDAACQSVHIAKEGERERKNNKERNKTVVVDTGTSD